MKNPQLQDNSQNADIAKDFIRQILSQLQDDYRVMREERHQLVIWEEEQEFTILGVIEAYTSDIRGYASQVIASDSLNDSQNLVLRLRELKLFDIPYFANWFFSAKNQYPQIEYYIEKLDYLRLLVIEYISLHQLNLQTAA